ncbi:MAG: hypothetical protein SXA11_05410 [Cyanobacteriota bacterium]|nr:hypothetical protein [Cyanobacteriota bacterium]
MWAIVERAYCLLANGKSAKSNRHPIASHLSYIFVAIAMHPDFNSIGFRFAPTQPTILENGR